MATALVTCSIVAFLIFVNAVYVAAEFGAVSARRSRIQELAGGGNWLAGLLLPVVRSASALDRYVATCQIGITISSLVLGAYGQAVLAVALAPLVEDWGRLQPLVAHSTAAIVVLIALTAAQVVLGELVPKSLALQHPTTTALWTVLPMRWSMAAFRWFIVVLNGSGVFLLHRIGMAVDRHRHIHSPEEIELLIAESRDGGLLEPDEQQRLHKALQLRLHVARQLMVPRTSMVALDAQWSGERVFETVLATPFSRLPVYEGTIDRVIGLLATRDFVSDYVRNHRPDRFRSLLRPIKTVPETLPADELLQFLRDHRIRQALVIDEFGGIAGLVTLADVLTDLLGDTGDDGGGIPRGAEHLADGRIRVPGQMPLTELQRWLGTAWDSNADTVAGHVMEVLGRLPVEGERLTIDGIEIEIQRLTGRVPGSVVVTPAREGKERPGG